MEDLPTPAFIASELNEADYTAREQIAGIVTALGEHKALALLEEALEIVDGGGLRVTDGSRKRSPGGVFFHLARRLLSRDAKQRIFYGKGSRSASASDEAAVKDAAKDAPEKDAPDEVAVKDAVRDAPPAAAAPARGRRRIVALAETPKPLARERAASAPKPSRAVATRASASKDADKRDASKDAGKRDALKREVKRVVEATLARLPAADRYELLFDLMRAARAQGGPGSNGSAK